MKRPVLLVAVLLSLGVVVPGCPIYNEEGCVEDAHCAPGYVCELATGECVEPVPECTRPSDCSAGSTCDREGRCRSVDCSWEDVGCVSGYTCVRDDGVWRCVSSPSGAGGETSGSAGETSSGGQGPSGGAAQGGASSGGEPSAGGASSAGAAGEAAGGTVSVGGAAAAGADAGGTSGAAGAGGAGPSGGQGGA